MKHNRVVVLILYHSLCLMQLQVSDSSESTCSNTEEIKRAAIDKALADIGCDDHLCTLFKAFPELNQTTTDIPGLNSSNPARSCADILDANAQSPSGYYWLQSTNGSAVRVYCNMILNCKGVGGGWMQVVKLNMTDTNQQCPPGLSISSANITTTKRLCGLPFIGPGCSSDSFTVNGINYDQVCGKIIAYQYATPDAFNTAVRGPGQTLDGNYVDGISLTYGSNPTKHIWTFAAALDELEVDNAYNQYRCPCTVLQQNSRATPPPCFVGDNYFCDTSPTMWSYSFYPDDPLWDGTGCGPSNTCCTFNRPPWFLKQLPQTTSSDIRMRMCRDNFPVNGLPDEDTPIEIIEIYVR